MITSVIAKEDNGNVQITFTIPFNEIKKAKEDTIAEFAKDVNVPGFRKGNAPLDKVKEKIPESTIIEHALSHLLPKALSDAIEDNKLKIAIYPKFELVSAEEGKDWQIKGVTCELPEINLGDYKTKVAGVEKKEEIVIKALVQDIKLTIPTILIEEEANSRLSNLLARIEKLGLTLESYLTSIGKNVESLRAEYAAQAKEAISLDLILTKIGEVENLDVTNEDIETAISMSQTMKDEKLVSPEEIENRKRLVESILKRRKALDFVINLK